MRPEDGFRNRRGAPRRSFSPVTPVDSRTTGILIIFRIGGPTFAAASVVQNVVYSFAFAPYSQVLLCLRGAFVCPNCGLSCGGIDLPAPILAGLYVRRLRFIRPFCRRQFGIWPKSANLET